MAFNEGVRLADEWFDEPDDLDRVRDAIAAVDELEDPIEAAATLAYRISRAQGFGEGNKRTGLLLARWTLDRNRVNGASILPADDQNVGRLLVRAAAGEDISNELLSLLRERESAS